MERGPTGRASTASLLGTVFAAAALLTAPAFTDDGPDDGDGHHPGGEQILDGGGTLQRPDPAHNLIEHDEATAGMVVNDGPFADVIKNLAPSGRGERVDPEATTDVWVLGRYACIGTFNEPCGDGIGANGCGVHIFDARNSNKVKEIGIISTPVGIRSNDVNIAELNSSAILVHSNEDCDGGPSGFEIWDAGDPRNPIHLASVQIDELNPISDALFGGLTDLGVHNLWLFMVLG